MIELTNVSFGYGDEDILSDVTLDLTPGSFHFLTGPSGSGKTTLLRMCYGDLAPKRGQIALFGKDLAGFDRDDLAMARRRLGVVHQDCQFLDHLSVTDNVALPLIVSGRDYSSQELRELLGWVGLSARADALPAQLSGGERQRAALARAVMMSPDVILADEPTGNLDWEMSLRLLTLLIELNKSGKTVLLATHDLNLVRAAKAEIPARTLRIKARQLQLAGSEL